MVKPKNSNSVQLSAANVPAKAEELSQFLNDEIPKLWAAIKALAAGHFDVTYVAPEKPRPGDVKYADGTSWNPGSGEGFYYFKASTSTWIFWG
jgi:hypothetical protein